MQLRALALRPTGALAATLTPATRVALALGIAALTPLVCALQLLILNGATILFPAWFQTLRSPGPGSGGGIELMGPRPILVFGQFLVVPPAPPLLPYHHAPSQHLQARERVRLRD